MKPIASMTGFSLASRGTAAGTLSVELRAVNSRFLDLSVRIADELRWSEQAVREAITAAVARGKVECRIGLRAQGATHAPRINELALAQLGALERQVRTALPGTSALDLGYVLGWPGVVEAVEVDTEALRAATLDALHEALEALQQARRREGDALRRILLERCDAIEAIATGLQTVVPQLRAALERKLLERLLPALSTPLAARGAMSREEVAERIRQEVALYGMRADVEEELKRLGTHVQEVRRLLDAGGPVGRRLDFLMQELNREANTLGSKASAIEMTHAAIDLKLAIEQMREQIQNLE